MAVFWEACTGELIRALAYPSGETIPIHLPDILADMPNFASLLKDEISRLARKEVRAHTDALKKASATYRHEIAALKKEVKALQGALKRSQKQASSSRPAPEEVDSSGLRYSAKGLLSHRKRLGLSREQLGQLVGASGQAVYLWESQRGRPRSSYLPALAELRKLGKREVARRLEALAEAA